jgi:hypothetical protein
MALLVNPSISYAEVLLPLPGNTDLWTAVYIQRPHTIIENAGIVDNICDVKGLAGVLYGDERKVSLSSGSSSECSLTTQTPPWPFWSIHQYPMQKNFPSRRIMVSTGWKKLSAISTLRGSPLQIPISRKTVSVSRHQYSGHSFARRMAQVGGR